MKRKSLVFLAALLITAQTAWAQVTVTTVDGLLEAVKTSQTVTLGADITTPSEGGRLDINNGITVTLDLNGHTLKRDMTAVHPGGQAIIVETGGNLTIMDSGSGGTITGGWANGGGGIYVREGGVLTIKGGTISGNRTEKDANGDWGDGGGVDNWGTLTISGGTISGNQAVNGGAIYNHTTGTLTMTGGTISGNTATDGGGICNEGLAQITGVTISGNTASGNGGGIDISGTADGSVVLTDVTITDNTAQANGGGISLWKPETPNCTVELKGACAITGNTAGLSGGGIYHHGFGTYRPGPTLKMQETPVVQDNAPTDVHLGSYQLITLSDALTTDAHVGVYCADEAQTVFTSGYKTCNGDTAPATFFFASSPTVSGNVVWSGDEAAIQATGYKYVERGWDGTKVTETTKVCENYTVINGSDTSDESGWYGLGNGWYVVTGNPSYKTLNVQGTDVHLILCNGTQLTVTGGVKLESDHQLSIYSQPKSSSVTGKLIANNEHYSGAAIGGGDEGTAAGALIVHGGDIEAKPTYSGPAAIGGGKGAGFSPTGGLTVYGGTITATAQFEGAGIGSGSDCNTSAGNITIYGGMVKATGGGNNASPYDSGAGIGGGDGSPGANVSIYGGTVIATAGGGDANQQGRGIGCGYDGTGTTTLTLYDNAMVTAGTAAGADYSRAFTASERVAACQSQKYVLIEPCTHSGSNYTISDGATHHTNCTYCQVGAGNQPETHTFGDDGKCLCGLVALSGMADNRLILTTWNGQNVPVTLSGHTLYKDGSWNTLCLPFALDSFDGTPLEGATVKTLTDASYDKSNGTLTLAFTDNLTAIEAGKPYIVKWENTEGTEQTEGTELKNPVFNKVTISKTTTDVTTSNVTFNGTFSPLSMEAADKTMLYLGDGNTLCYPSAETIVSAFRAVFKLKVLDGFKLSTLADIVVGKTEESAGADDVNGDNQVSIADVTTLIDRLATGGVKAISNVDGLILGTNGVAGR